MEDILDIIGKDCYNIIKEYKEELELYEQNVRFIKKCINEKDIEKKYNIDMSLETFYLYYEELENKIILEYNIIINKNNYEINYYKYSLKNEMVKLLNIENICYCKSYGKDVLTLILKPKEEYFNDYLFNTLLSTSMKLKLKN